MDVSRAITSVFTYRVDKFPGLIYLLLQFATGAINYIIGLMNQTHCAIVVTIVTARLAKYTAMFVVAAQFNIF